MRKVIKILGILFFLMIVVVFSWKLNAYFSMSAEERFFYKELKSKLNKGEREIFIKDLTNFDWDQVCFFGPYGVPFDIPWHSNEGVWTTIFITSKTEYAFKISRKLVDIVGKNDSYGCYIPSTFIEVSKNRNSYSNYKIIRVQGEKVKQ